MSTNFNAGSATGTDLAALTAIQNRIALAYRLCLSLAPKQAVGELLETATNMPEWETVRAALARATPQHSVTEQASVPDGWLLAQREPSQEQLNYAAYNMNRKRNGPDMVTAEFLRECWSNLLHSRPTFKSSAQPLASTAATHPEQASIETWENRYNAMPGGLSDSDVRKCMEAEIADLRAALAIPASTARDVCAEMRALCSACGGTGDVHSITGEWHGRCDCPASTAASEQPTICVSSCFYGDCPPCVAAGLRPGAASEQAERTVINYGIPAASEQEAGADERVLFDALNTIADLSSHIDIGIVETINELANAALTHRATTATELFCGMDYVRTPTAAPAVAITAADQQGDTLPRWIDDLKGSDPTIDGLIEYIIAQQGAAQAQAGAAPALMRGAVGSVASNADGEIRVNWMRPERVEAGTLLYVIDRAAMAAPATSGGGNG